MNMLAKSCAAILLFSCAVSAVDAKDRDNASDKVRQLSGAGVAGAEDLPPRFSTTFTQEEFNTFISDPKAGLEKLGYKVEHITVSIRDTVWIPKDKKWGESQILRDLPPSQSWGWLCGYEDEMCVCYPVLM